MFLLRHGQSYFNLHMSRTRVDPGIEDPELTPLGESLMAGTFAAAARHRPLWRMTKPSRPDPPAGPSEG